MVLRDQALHGPRRFRGSRYRKRRSSAVRSPELLTFRVSAISPRPLRSDPGTFRWTDLGPVDVSRGLRPLLLHPAPLVPARDASGRKLDRGRQKLWDSLAVAGANAAAGNTPRAVLLMLGARPRDQSLLSLAQALHYLESIHVPLYVWAADNSVLDLLELPRRSRFFVAAQGIEEVAEQIAVELSSQTIIWVTGEYLPTEISLTERTPPTVSLIR